MTSSTKARDGMKRAGRRLMLALDASAAELERCMRVYLAAVARFRDAVQTSLQQDQATGRRHAHSKRLPRR
jgi:hypothetical protein